MPRSPRRAARWRSRPSWPRPISRSAFVLFAGQARCPRRATLLRQGLCARAGQCRHHPALRLILLARGPRRGRAQRDQPRDRARPAQPAHVPRGRIDRLCRAPLCGSAGTAAARAGAQSADQQCAVADRQLPAAARPTGRGEKGLCGRAARAVPLHRPGDRRTSTGQPSRRRARTCRDARRPWRQRALPAGRSPRAMGSPRRGDCGARAGAPHRQLGNDLPRDRPVARPAPLAPASSPGLSRR